MSNTLYDIDFTRALPLPLKNDKTMLALAQSIAGELQKTAHLSKKNIIYARIDELSEEVLDVLAYDLHVDWYDYTYPMAAKREVIRDSVRVHKRLGTLYAVETALGSVYPESEVEEWFDYGGKPFSFRVVLDVTSARAPVDFFQIKRAVDSYKRLAAHMDELIYQSRSNIDIAIEAKAFLFSAGVSGRNFTGTLPQRNITGNIMDQKIRIPFAGAGFIFNSPRSGTIPRHNISAVSHEKAVTANTAANPFIFGIGYAGQYRAGTEPHRATIGASTSHGMDLDTQPQNFRYNSPITGTIPNQNLTANQEGSGLTHQVDAKGYSYRVKRCGTSHCK